MKINIFKIARSLIIKLTSLESICAFFNALITIILLEELFGVGDESSNISDCENNE